ncbi:MAG: hypothetical protein IPN42_07370 [Methylococcaceae bacterium]|nr:hypothetical protein [Methylococcaceae bacterium]
MKTSLPYTKTALFTLTMSLSVILTIPAYASCPEFGWSEGLANYLGSNATMPVDDTQPIPTPDCNFHEWSWEAFAWATALDGNGIPRFLSMQTPEDLLSGKVKSTKSKPVLKLAGRSLHPFGSSGFTEGAGAIVEADGKMLVAPNGYPVYASVHMNPTYFATAKKNLIATNGYNTQPTDGYFSLGDAVFKATWLRLDQGQTAPQGAFTTQAEVPVLSVLRTKSQYTVVPSSNTVTVTVALVGLHVVGYTANHPEFLWATFEHNLNSPATADNTFDTSGSNTGTFTFYVANTPYTQVNQPNPPQSGQSYIPPQLLFNPLTQKFTPSNNAVQENATGGENQEGGPANVTALNASAQSFFAGQKGGESAFANYHLVGTVWMLPNTYVLPNALAMNQVNAVGSISLANSTAETFVQSANNTSPSKLANCFSCHNATSYNFQNPPPDKLASRRIAISHVLSVGTPYAVPNLLTVPIVRDPKAPVSVR